MQFPGHIANPEGFDAQTAQEKCFELSGDAKFWAELQEALEMQRTLIKKLGTLRGKSRIDSTDY